MNSPISQQNKHTNPVLYRKKLQLGEVIPPILKTLNDLAENKILKLNTAGIRNVGYKKGISTMSPVHFEVIVQ